MTIDLKKALADLRSGRPLLNCGEVFDLVVQHTIQVANCGKYTQAEEDQMANGLLREWRNKAQAQCDQLGTACQTPTPNDVKEVGNACQNNLWTVSWSVKTKCTP